MQLIKPIKKADRCDVAQAVREHSINYPPKKYKDNPATLSQTSDHFIPKSVFENLSSNIPVTLVMGEQENAVLQ